MKSMISVVIPAYNSSKTILPCLLSLRAQTVAPLEIIVVDDASADNTADLAKNYSTVIKNTHNKGAGGARNTGAAVSRGEIIAFTDSDCVLPPTWLQKISEALCGEGVGAVASGYSGHAGSSFIGALAHLELLRRRKSFGKFVETAPSNNFAVKREVFDAVGGFPELFAAASSEDVVFSFNVSRRCGIRWLEDNGIKHHFRDTVKGYLAQQYVFARDTVLMYAFFPGIKRVKTHQGFLIYFEAIVSAMTLIAVLKIWPWFLLGIFALWGINAALLLDVYRVLGINAAVKTALFVPGRDFNWVYGEAAGFVLTAVKYFRTKTNSPPP